MSVSEPAILFQSFLEELINIGWIESVKWLRAINNNALRQLMRGDSLVGSTRSHKKISAGEHLGLVAKLAPKTEVGVDLELLQNRVLMMKNRESIAVKLGLPPTASLEQVICAWSAREAAVKALSQYDRLFPDVSWKSLRVRRPGVFEGLYEGKVVRFIEYRQCVQGELVLSFARCALSIEALQGEPPA